MTGPAKSLDALLIEMSIRGGTCAIYPIRREEMDSWIERLSEASGVPIFGLSIEEYAKQVAQLQTELVHLERLVAELQAYSRALDGRTTIRASRCEPEPSPRQLLASQATLHGPAVYALVDPRDPDRLRYVGQSVNPVARYMAHLAAPPNSRVAAWIAELRAEGHMPAMVLVESVEEVSQIEVRESHWIHASRAAGQADLNISIRRIA